MRQRRWIELFSNYEYEIRYRPGKANVVADALSRKERVKPRRVRAMGMTIQSGVKSMVLAAQSEAFKEENTPIERLHGLDQEMERKEDDSLYFMDRIWVSLVGGVRTIIMDEAHKTRRKPLEFEVGDQVLLKVSPWKGVIRFRKKGKLAPRYVGPFEILERIGPKCLADANLHVPLDEFKVDKTLRFVEEPVEIMDSEVKSLKCSKIPIVNVRWNSKRGPEFTWEHKDHKKAKYPRLFLDYAVEPTS
ncbi:hypothetical protein Tco_0375452 [Tanacetum coccineum]